MLVVFINQLLNCCSYYAIRP